MRKSISLYPYITLIYVKIIYTMSEEKIRNSKGTIPETVGSDSIPSFLLKTY